jgi:CAAX protease family protein
VERAAAGGEVLFCPASRDREHRFPAGVRESAAGNPGQPSVLAMVWSSFVPYLFFGFYQEVVYRGILQSDSFAAGGALAGILSANLFYTFGPLHWYYFAAHASLAVPMFAGIFAIGLFFGVLFWRSGNLWIVAVIHGIGNAYIVGSLLAGR